MTVPILRVGKDPHRQCPICGRTGWCGVSADGTFAICMRVPSDQPSKNGGYVHRLTPGTVPVVDVLPPADIARADSTVLDRAYRQLLAGLPLSQKHRVDLLRRGLTPAQIAQGMFRTLPAGPQIRYRLAQRVYNPRGVPGFYEKEGRYGPYSMLHGRAGLIVPVRNLDGQTVGVQSRRDDPADGHVDETPKYVWVSSAGLSGGCSPCVPVHVARPRRLWQSAVWVTEGVFKAEIAAYVLGAVVISVQGVNNWHDVPAAARALKAQRLVVAYDADKASKSEVAKASLDLQTALVSEGLLVQEATWDPSVGKGLDDVLVKRALKEVKVA